MIGNPRWLGGVRAKVRGQRVGVLAGAVLAVMSLGSVVEAKPASVNVVELGVGFRYGIQLDHDARHPWGPGAGADFGITFESNLFLGVQFDYFFGDWHSTLWQVMPDLGYDIGLGGPLVFRLKGGAGPATLKRESARFAVDPGASLLYFGSKCTLMLDGRYDLIFDDRKRSAVVLSAGIGF